MQNLLLEGGCGGKGVVALVLWSWPWPLAWPGWQVPGKSMYCIFLLFSQGLHSGQM